MARAQEKIRPEKRVWTGAGWLVLGVLMAGCSDMGTEPPPALSAPPAGATVSFQRDLRPIFTRYGCTTCHGGNGGLTIGTVQQLIQGGRNGPAVVPGNSAGSIIIRKLSPSPPFGDRMPQGGPYLPDSTIQVIRDWIDQGARDN